MVDGAVSLAIAGRYASIGALRWDSVPPLAVITGANGAGKSQLLEVIANSYGALKPSPWQRLHAQIGAWAEFEPEDFSPGEVFHSYGEWTPLTSVPASDNDITNAIYQLQAERRDETVMQSLAADLGVDVGKIRDLTPRQFLRVLTPGVLWTYAHEEHRSLSALFLAYRYFERVVSEAGQSLEELHERVGEEPWQLMSSIIQAAGLPFTINHPGPLAPTLARTNEVFEFKLRDVEGNVVPIEQLSSGERVLMATATWRYQTEITGKHFRLLLLDEPDAHLHPSLTRRFLNVIREVFVEQRKVRVIMTTHSPSTVALTPEGCLFEMRRTEPRLRGISRAEAIASLTGGFVAVQDATRTVLLEGREDPPFYRQVWQLLVEPTTAGRSGAISAYPNINFVHGQGRQTVRELVTQLRSAGFTNFFGVIDRDRGNVAEDAVFVLSRYAIENYLYDPLNVWMCINLAGRTREYGLYEPSNMRSLRDLPVSVLQGVADSVIQRVEGRFPCRDAADLERVPVEYHNGVVLSYPRWCLMRAKGDIKTQYSRTFLQLSTRDLLDAYAAMNMVSTDLVSLYKSIQGTLL